MHIIKDIFKHLKGGNDKIDSFIIGKIDDSFIWKPLTYKMRNFASVFTLMED